MTDRSISELPVGVLAKTDVLPFVRLGSPNVTMRGNVGDIINAVSIEAPVDPGPAANQAAGHGPGSVWRNTVTGAFFRYLREVAGLAEWAPMDFADNAAWTAGRATQVMPWQHGGTVVIPAADLLILVPAVFKPGPPIQSLGLRVGSGGGGGAGAAIKMGVWRVDLAAREPRGLPLVSQNVGVPATGPGLSMLSPSSGPWAPTPGVLCAIGFVSAPATPQPSVSGGANGNTVAVWLAQQVLANAASGTFQFWTLSQPYTNDISALNIAGGLAQGVGTFPMPIAQW